MVSQYLEHKYYFSSFLTDSILQFFDPMPPKFEFVGWHIFGYILSWCETFINPFIYVAANKFLRNAFLKTFFGYEADQLDPNINKTQVEDSKDNQTSEDYSSDLL